MGKINSSWDKGFKKGYEINNKVMSDNQLNKKFQQASKKTEKSKSYPNGMIPFGFLLAFYIITLITCLVVLQQRDSVMFYHHWHTTVISVAIAYLLMNVLWAIGRTGFLSAAGYSFMKFGRFIRWSDFRTKVEYHGKEPALSDVQTPEDFKAFCLERKGDC